MYGMHKRSWVVLNSYFVDNYTVKNKCKLTSKEVTAHQKRW